MGRVKWTGRVALDDTALDLPRRWPKGRMIFVNSMSDLFHEAVPLDFIRQVFAVMADTPRHTYQILTKRAERLAELAPYLPWPDHVWMGVSVEKQDYWSRVEHLRRTGARVKFLSLEPLLGPLPQLVPGPGPGSGLAGIDWVIAGGESGPGARPMDPGWVRTIRDACVGQGVAFHFKQWGGTNKKAAGRTLDGRTWDEWPETAQPRLRAAG